MTTLAPQGEALKKAIQWISDKRKADPEINLVKLADQAAFQFDLSPRDSEFLLRFLRQENG